MSVALNICITKRDNEEFPFRLKIHKRVFRGGSLEESIHIPVTRYKYLDACFQTAKQYVEDAMKGAPDAES